MLLDSAGEAPEAQPALAAEAADQEGDMALLEQHIVHDTPFLAELCDHR